MKNIRALIGFFTIFLYLEGGFAGAVPNVLTSQMKEMLKSNPEIPGISRVLISTLFMIVFIYVVAFFYKKISLFNSKALSIEDKSFDLNKLKIINSKSLSTNNAVHIVEVNGKYLVLGSTPNQISLLKEFDKNALVEEEVKSFDEGKEGVSQEAIEQGLKTLFPPEELEELEEIKSSDSEFEQIYKKYL